MRTNCGQESICNKVYARIELRLPLLAEVLTKNCSDFAGGTNKEAGRRRPAWWWWWSAH